MIDEIKDALSSYDGKWKEKKGVWEFKTTIAERKAFLSKKKLTYQAKMRIVDEDKIVKFTEMLVQKGSGLSSGGMDGDMGGGFGFKAETYSNTKGSNDGSIEEQSNLFGKDFSYEFDYKEIRSKVEEIATKNGYEFKYQITSKGL